MKKKSKSLVGIIMGSKSDWAGVMEHCSDTLKQFGIKHDVRVISAHRTPKRLHKFLKEAERDKMEVIIAAAGMSAHLAGVTASLTTLPVLGVPTESKLKGLDSLLSTVQMPSGIPVGTLAIGKAGAPALKQFQESRQLERLRGKSEDRELGLEAYRNLTGLQEEKWKAYADIMEGGVAGEKSYEFGVQRSISCKSNPSRFKWEN